MRKTISVSEFCNHLKSNTDCMEGSDEPITVKLPKGRNNLVVLSEAAFLSMEETIYLLSTEANRIHLKQSMEDFKAGRVTSIPLGKLWK